MPIEKSESLNHIEKQELKDCELIIDDGLRGFIAVGNALAKIRDEKLYREHFSSFEKYVKSRWQMNKDYAYKLMSGSEVAQRVEGIENEFQARELNRVPFTEQEKVMKRAISNADLEDREVTAKDIREAASEPTTLTARSTGDDVWLPEHQTELWEMAEEVADEMRDVYRKLSAHPEGCWLQAHADTIEAKLRDIRNMLKHCKPEAPCPECMGGLKKFCDVCRSRGWLPKGRYEAYKKRAT